MTRKDCILTLREEYAAQREENERDQSRRIALAERLDPQIAALRAENISLALDAMRAMAHITDDAERRARADAMRDKGVANNAKIRARLKALGLPDDQLSLRCRCNECRDTGLVGDAPARFCRCFEARLHQMQYRDGASGNVEEQSFENFDLSVFPSEEDQRVRMEKYRKVCEDYANALPTPPKAGILLAGQGGLGKTYLLNCIFLRAVQRNVPTIRISAFRLFEIMRRCHIEGQGMDGGFQELIDVPVLCIDDLGTEPMMRNITVEYLFVLLNERMAANRCTVITTNYMPKAIEEYYGNRIASRLMDLKYWTPLKFVGKDVRKL